MNHETEAFQKKNIRALVVVFVCSAWLIWTTPSAIAQVSAPVDSQDRPGGDFFGFDLPEATYEANIPWTPLICQDACSRHENCQAYTYVKPGVQGPRARCYLKSSVPPAVTNNCCLSGVRTGNKTGEVLINPNPESFSVMTGFDRFGGDYANRVLALSALPTDCQAICRADSNCRAYTFTAAQPNGVRPVCYLKSAVTPATPCARCTSGVKIGAPDVNITKFGYAVGRRFAVDTTRPLLVVILSGFLGAAATYTPQQDAAYFERLIFGPGEPNIASYFYEASDGKFAWVKAGVIGPINIGASPSSSNGLRTLAKVLAASNGFDFLSHDRNGDGEITRDELTILVIDNFSLGSGQTNETHCTTISGGKVCAGVSLVGIHSTFSNIAHELAHHLEQWDIYGATSLTGLCIANNLGLGSCTVTNSPVSRNSYVSVYPDPWHRIYWGWTAPLVISMRDPGGCYDLDAQQSGRGTPLIFYDPTRGFGEYFLAEYRNPNLPSFRQASYQDPAGNLIARPMSYDAAFPNPGVLLWWVQTRNGVPFNRRVAIVAGQDNRLQTTLASRDIILDANGDGQNEILAGPDGVVQSVLNPNDAALQDMTLYPSVDPARQRPQRWGQVPLLNGTSTSLRWFNRGLAPIAIRVAPIAPSSDRAALEWGSVKLRIDEVRPAGDLLSGQSFTILGQFGVSNNFRSRRAVLIARSNGSRYFLAPVRWACNQVTFTVPVSLPDGEYYLQVEASIVAESSNQIRVIVR